MEVFLSSSKRNVVASASGETAATQSQNPSPVWPSYPPDHELEDTQRLFLNNKLISTQVVRWASNAAREFSLEQKRVEKLRLEKLRRARDLRPNHHKRHKDGGSSVRSGLFIADRGGGSDRGSRSTPERGAGQILRCLLQAQIKKVAACASKLREGIQARVDANAIAIATLTIGSEDEKAQLLVRLHAVHEKQLEEHKSTDVVSFIRIVRSAGPVFEHCNIGDVMTSTFYTGCATLPAVTAVSWLTTYLDGTIGSTLPTDVSLDPLHSIFAERTVLHSEQQAFDIVIPVCRSDRESMLCGFRWLRQRDPETFHLARSKLVDDQDTTLTLTARSSSGRKTWRRRFNNPEGAASWLLLQAASPSQQSSLESASACLQNLIASCVSTVAATTPPPDSAVLLNAAHTVLSCTQFCSIGRKRELTHRLLAIEKLRNLSPSLRDVPPIFFPAHWIGTPRNLSDLVDSLHSIEVMLLCGSMVLPHITQFFDTTHIEFEDFCALLPQLRGQLTLSHTIDGAFASEFSANVTQGKSAWFLLRTLRTGRLLASPQLWKLDTDGLPRHQIRPPQFPRLCFKPFVSTSADVAQQLNDKRCLALTLGKRALISAGMLKDVRMIRHSGSSADHERKYTSFLDAAADLLLTHSRHSPITTSLARKGEDLCVWMRDNNVFVNRVLLPWLISEKWMQTLIFDRSVRSDRESLGFT